MSPKSYSILLIKGETIKLFDKELLIEDFYRTYSDVGTDYREYLKFSFIDSSSTSRLLYNVFNRVDKSKSFIDSMMFKKGQGLLYFIGKDAKLLIQEY